MSYIRTIEHKEKLRESIRKSWTPERRARHRVIMKKTWSDPIKRRNMSLALRGRKVWTEGKPLPYKTRLAIGEALRGRPRTLASRRKQSETCRKKYPPGGGGPVKMTSEMRAHLSEIRSKLIKEGKFHPNKNGFGGKMFSRKNKRVIRYRSQLERRWFEKLERDVKVVRYDVEPVIIRYRINNCWRNYIPDVRVYRQNGTSILVEIKPESLWTEKKNRQKWYWADEWCRRRLRLTRFEVWGYEGIYRFIGLT